MSDRRRVFDMAFPTGNGTSEERDPVLLWGMLITLGCGSKQYAGIRPLLLFKGALPPLAAARTPDKIDRESVNPIAQMWPAALLLDSLARRSRRCSRRCIGEGARPEE
jgi:hypothetical protein